MTVAGQPKNTAEYIQATSRVGRRYPGLVYMVYNWSRPRDLSHYERFAHYHATFYQHVEPLSVTPFSPRALDRGLTGVLVSLIRLLGSDFNPNANAGQLERHHPFVQQALNEISRRAGLIMVSTTVEAEVRRELDDRLDQWLDRAGRLGSGLKLGYMEARREMVQGLLEQPTGHRWHDFICLNSLRDVEPGVGLILDNRGMEQQRTATTVVADATE